MVWVWHDASLASPRASSPEAGELVARRLLAAGPDEVASLPPHLVRWLWTHGAIRPEATALMLAWAVQPAQPRQLGVLCRGDAHAASILVSLLSSELALTRSQPDGTRAVLALVQECISPPAAHEAEGAPRDDDMGELEREATPADGSEGSGRHSSGVDGADGDRGTAYARAVLLAEGRARAITSGGEQLVARRMCWAGGAR